jgi:hypothetical protein
MRELLAEIEAPGPKGFVAGIVLWDDRVVEAAPIVRWMRGLSRQAVREHCERKGWTITVVHLLERSKP